jgi:hypothetical protein
MKTRTKTILVLGALTAGVLLAYTINGNLVVTGTVSSGSGSGKTGILNLTGKTSGKSSSISVDDSNTATATKLPNDSTSGLYLVTSPTATPAAGCAQFNGTSTQAASTGTACGSGGGGATITRGVFASAPSCSASSLYFSTDISLEGQCNGSTYQWFWQGIPVTLPSLGSWTFQNQGGASQVTNGIITMTAPSGAGDSVRGYFVTLPSRPFTQDACFSGAISQDQFNQFGIYESDGTKLLTLGLQTGISGTGANADNSAAFAVSQWTNVTTFASRSGSTFWSTTSQMDHLCFRWNDDSTNNNWSFSVDGGASWNLLLTAGDTAFLTPTRIGFFMDVNKQTGGISQSATTTLFHWLSH